MAINAWEKRKLASLVHFIGTGKSTFTLHPSKDKIFRFPVLGSTSIIGYDSSYDVEGKMILTARVGANAGNLYIYSGKAKITDNTVFLVTDTPSFLKALLDHFDLKKIKFGTGQPLIKASELKRLKLFVPCDPTELDSIQDCVLNINNLIAATQGKLDQLEMVKKALLQHLFDQSMRFKGYSDPWEKRKLGDLGQVAMNKRIYKDQTSSTGDVPFYKIGTFGKEADSFISRELFEKYKKMYPFPEAGDILISASGSIGRKLVYDGEDAYFQDSNIIWIKHDERLANSFLNQFLSIVHWNGTEGTTIKRLYNKNVLTTKINIPSRKEQDTIGSCLTIFDNLIAATQSKLSGLESLKKALLQGLFI
ncbi:restriction endonuclease subunit S [Lacticaseibacillus huelsenbergensis]|uniref:Restriction endonuclease subunit S n=1 Tax=Lacticaseibacillus huelsenbergensis TaxID=3035291 RepID=A0ABY8DXU5_9LACO|nr:restriction endonuclease subunit S [Lacticaseibacillus huelsenbergensis]WFB40602.1 restriction endonuclease subunit S [Lacticaseibacillus huelsenbergensis]